MVKENKTLSYVWPITVALKTNIISVPISISVVYVSAIVRISYNRFI